MRAREVAVAVGDEDLPGFYEFSCPHCLAQVRLAAPARVLELLALSGAALRPRAPAPSASALTPDDLLEFHELLASEDWWPRLVETFSAPGT